MATISDSIIVIFVDYFEKGNTGDWPYYAKSLGQFDEKNGHIWWKKRYCSVHICAVATLVELGYVLVPHPAYSPVLTSNDKTSFFFASHQQKTYNLLIQISDYEGHGKYHIRFDFFYISA